MLCTNYHYLNNATTYLGKFVCPQPGMGADKAYCCGDVNNQYCCAHIETSGAKWGLTVGIIIGILILAVLAYTIHAIRALDRCYHECPACGDDDTFKMDCRWYTVSNEGNRYGVTFHSRKFARIFMDELAERYGRWNQADILRIKKRGKSFVVLTIYYNDLFTPWFYTQGPMKNDTEWINTDFVELVTVVKHAISVPLCCGKKRQLDSNQRRKSDRATDSTSGCCNKRDFSASTRSNNLTVSSVSIDEPTHRSRSKEKKCKSKHKSKKLNSDQMMPEVIDAASESERKIDDYLQGSRAYLQIHAARWHTDPDADVNIPSVIIEDVEPLSSHSGSVNVSRSTNTNSPASMRSSCKKNKKTLSGHSAAINFSGCITDAEAEVEADATDADVDTADLPLNSIKVHSKSSEGVNKKNSATEFSQSSAQCEVPMSDAIRSSKHSPVNPAVSAVLTV